MAKNYLDYEGLVKYHSKIKAELDKKTEVEPGKGLSTNDFTTAEKEKLEGLKNYILPAATEEALGGIMVEITENPVPAKTALKADATGKLFVDWSEAPQASASDPGLIKIGNGLEYNAETNSVDVKLSEVSANTVPWSGITDKPDIALKSDLTAIYKYKGSVSTYTALPEENNAVGDVYNVEASGMNYAWTGTEWDALGEMFEIDSINDEQIEALFTSAT